MSPTGNFGPVDEQIRVEAADWFARMRGPEAAVSRAAFEAWYAIPAHARAYQQMVRRWEQSAFISRSPTGQDRHLRRASFLVRYPYLSAAAALTAIIGGTALLYGEYRARNAGIETAMSGLPLRYESGATIHDVALSDGSRITLDKASLILVSYSPARRSVQLARGRVRFRPARDPTRPFVVRAGASEVVAGGTMFDVAYQGGTAVVNAVAGRVSVRSATMPARLVLASQRIIVPDNGPPGPAELSPPTEADWLPRMIMLDHTSLADAALQVGRDAPAAILFTDDASALQITGTFRSGDIESLANAAQALFHLKRSRDSVGNIVLSR